MNLLKLTLSILTCSVISSTFAAADYYVKVGGAGSMDGTSWADAFGDLQVAINTASAGDEIWVATGTYKPSHDNPRSGENTARDVTFYIDKNIQIYGGFQGNESFLSQRDLKNDPVVLSGDLGVAGSAYHVLYIDGSSNPIATSCILDGFHIVGGSADGSVPDNVGGGILIDGAGMGGQAKPTIRNCIFQDNMAQSGGAIFNEGFDGVCSPSLGNCLFTANHATFGGGAIYNNGFGGESTSNYDNCTFSKNTATAHGPAIFNDGRSSGTCEPIIDNCIIWDNGGVQHDIYNLEATTKISKSILDDGTADAVITTPGVSVVGVGTLDEDPIFNDPTMADFTLQLCSPAINSGATSSLSHDICGNTRTFLSVVDMGAYENIQVLCPASGQPIYVDQDVGVCIGTTWANAHEQGAIFIAKTDGCP